MKFFVLHNQDGADPMLRFFFFLKKKKTARLVLFEHLQRIGLRITAVLPLRFILVAARARAAFSILRLGPHWKVGRTCRLKVVVACSARLGEAKMILRVASAHRKHPLKSQLDGCVSCKSFSSFGRC